MGQSWDRAFLQSRLEHCRARAAAALEPGIRTAYLGYASHYELLLAQVGDSRRTLVPRPVTR